VVVDGERQPGSLPRPIAAQCVVDDLRDKGNSMSFAIDITSPGPGETVSDVPTPVTGEVCHGLFIQHVSVNGLSLDTSGQSFTPGDGEDSGNTYRYTIDTQLDQTDIAADLAGGVSTLGTFDRGSNRLIAEAIDENSNRTFKSFIFAVGQVATPGQVALSTLRPGSIGGAQLNGAAREAMGHLLPADAGTEISNAFVLGFNQQALNTYFQPSCADPATRAALETRMNEIVVGQCPDHPERCHFSQEIPVDNACDPTVDFTITQILVPQQPTCEVILGDHKVTLAVTIPKVIVRMHAYGSCDNFFTSVTICSDGFTSVPDVGAPMRVEFDFGESEFITGGEAPGRVVSAADYKFCVSSDLDCATDDGDCGTHTGGFLAVLLIIFGAILLAVAPPLGVALIAIGIVVGVAGGGVPLDGIAHSGDIRNALQATNFTHDVKAIMLDDQTIAAAMLHIDEDLESVQINPQGLMASVKATFSSTSTDPEIEGIPGYVPTPAPPPAPPQSAAKNTYFVMADDSINQLLASMTKQGKLKTACQTSGKTVDDLLPDDCETLAATPKPDETPDDTAKRTAIFQGVCHGIRRHDCETLTGATDPLTGRKQGACHGTRHDDCANIPTSGFNGEVSTCAFTPYFNIFFDMPLLFCPRVDIPPRLFLQDVTSTDAIESKVRLNDLFVTFVLDRDGSGTAGGDVGSLSGCFGTGADLTADCKAIAACLDRVSGPREVAGAPATREPR